MHRIFKSDLKVAKASARWIPHLLSEDDCIHNQASFNCKLVDVSNNSNDVRRWVRPIAGKISAQPSLFEIFPSKFTWLCRNNGRVPELNLIAIDRVVFLLYKKSTTFWDNPRSLRH